MSGARGPVTAVAAVLLAAVLFGTTGTAQALGPGSTTPLGVGAARLAVGGLTLLLLLPALAPRRRSSPDRHPHPHTRPSPPAASRSSVLGLWRTPTGLVAGLCTALYQVCFFAAVARTGVAIGTLVTIGSGPVLAGLLARWVLGERPGRTWVAATGLCLVGLGLLVLGGGATGHADPVGVVLALVSGLGYATYTVLAKRQLDVGHPPAVVMAGAFGLGGLLLLPVLATQPLGWLGEPAGVALALYLGLVTTTVAYLLFVRGLAVLAAGPVTTLVLAEPVVATALGVVVLGERLPPAGVVGAAVVLVGLLLQGRASSSPPVSPPVSPPRPA